MKCGVKILFLLIFLTIGVGDVYSSAWPRKKGESLLLFEFLTESTDDYFWSRSTDKTYGDARMWEVYFEYGILSTVAIGGYLIDYSYSTRYLSNDTFATKEIDNDIYANVFVLHNVYHNAKDVISLQYSVYFPVDHGDNSRFLNVIDARKMLELSLLYGRSDTINLLGYFINTALSYKTTNEFLISQITFSYKNGFYISDSSLLSLGYEYRHYMLDDEAIRAGYFKIDDLHQAKLSFDFKFLDNISIELLIYRNLYKTKSIGLAIQSLIYF